MKELSIGLSIKGNRLFNAQVLERKENVIAWGRALAGCSSGYGNFIEHWIWTSKDNVYSVGFGKFGKEYYSSVITWKDGHKGNNPSDMKPLVKKNGKVVDFDGSFDHVFNFFQHIQRACGDEVLEMLGCLMVRDAYLLDHKAVSGKYYYSPNENVVSAIMARCPEYDGISVEAYLHYIDAISQNEDTKYSTLGYETKLGYGRKNNLLTYAHLIAVLLGRASLSKLCGAFSRPPIGVAPISLDLMKEAFPMLNIR